ncbi:hypothetical protein CPB86DRAFT_783311 [Serendipita vermifera]|nr:hypothetical protein CPB86DRAFT_783311 [Serendipita vermifera]
MTGASAALCTGMHLVVSPLWRKALGEQKYLSLKRREQLYLAEKTISSINGIITGGLAVYAVASGSWRGDIIYPYPKSAHYALAFFTGYSIYDTSVMAIGAHEPMIMWLHHVCGVAGAAGMMYYRRLAFFPIMFAITELTVLPFNLIWYLSKFNVPRTSPVMKLALFIRAVAFLLVRAPMGIMGLLYAHYQTRGGLVELWNRVIVRREVPLVLGAGTFANTLAFMAFNMLWTIQAIKASAKASKKKSSD